MNDPMLLSVAAAEHPLIDIDWTIAIQFIIFVATAIVASKLLFLPYLKLRDSRHEGIEGQRAQAERFKAEAEARFHDYEQKLAAARARAHQENRKLQAQATTQERELVKEANARAAAYIAENRQTIATEVEQARKALHDKANGLGQQLAAKLLGREVT